MGLFREEVFTHKAQNLHGTINLAVPLSWQAITSSLLAIVFVAAAFLLSASYSRSESASGSVLPEQGILQVVPPRSGRVERVMVHEGMFVRKGTALARIRSEGTDRSGAGTQSSILSAIEQQQQGLAEQQASTRAAAVSEQAEFQAQVDGLRQEVRDLDAQIAVQHKLVGMARADLQQTQEIAVRGFISRRDLSAREETFLSRQQQLSALQQTQTAKLSSMAQAERARGQAAAKASGAAAALVASQAQLERDQATTRGDQGYLIVAPANGRIAALNVHVGDSANTQEPAMMVVPAGGRLIARLYVPSKAAGFVHTGQAVRLALDAYPHERFGTVDGVINIISSAPVLRSDKDGAITPFYVATAVMTDPSVRAYGRREVLLPGMTFTARIITERRSLVQWLFDPLLAAARQ